MAPQPIRRIPTSSSAWLHIETDDPVTGDLRVHGKQIINSSRYRLVTTYYEKDVTGPLGHHFTNLSIDQALSGDIWDPVL